MKRLNTQSSQSRWNEDRIKQEQNKVNKLVVCSNLSMSYSRNEESMVIWMMTNKG